MIWLSYPSARMVTQFVTEDDVIWNVNVKCVVWHEKIYFLCVINATLMSRFLNILIIAYTLSFFLKWGEESVTLLYHAWAWLVLSYLLVHHPTLR